MICKYDIEEILPRLYGPVKEIVDLEIMNGNTLDEIATIWPMPKVNVWFTKPLTDKYKSKYPQLIYSQPKDPHFWLEEYIDEENGFMVAAKY